MEPVHRLECGWCKTPNATEATSCRSCGAPLDVHRLVTDSGWREAPRLREGTEVRFGDSICQVEGEVVPVAEITLARGDRLFFEHQALLWKEAEVRLDIMPLAGGIRRMLAGMPFFLTLATGPGRLGFSRHSVGELLLMPLAAGQELDVREHAFMMASHTVQYSFVRIQGLRNILFGGQGMYIDRFTPAGGAGIVAIHGYGNVFERTLGAQESLILEPGGFLYKDASVGMEVVNQPLRSGPLGGVTMHFTRLTGPGRVGIQSMYHHHLTE